MSPSEGPPKRNWSVWRPHVVYTLVLLECLRVGSMGVGSKMVGMVSEWTVEVESLVLVCGGLAMGPSMESVGMSAELTRPLSERDESKDVLDAGDWGEAIVNIPIRLAAAIGCGSAWFDWATTELAGIAI